MILGPDGRPVDPRAHVTSPAAEVVDGLPSWLHGMAYRAADDTITLRVTVPESPLALAHLLALEMTPSTCRAFLDALGRCFNQSEQSSRVLDVPVSD